MSLPFESQLGNFDKVLTECGGIQVFTPELPTGWVYLGPTVFNTEYSGPMPLNKNGTIFRPIDQTAFCEIVDWIQVFDGINDEGILFSAWCPVPDDINAYALGGYLFIHGVDKPTKEQTAGIKAIRKDFISQKEPNLLIGQLNFNQNAVLSFWGIGEHDFVHSVTGSFIATKESSPVYHTLPMIPFMVSNT